MKKNIKAFTVIKLKLRLSDRATTDQLLQSPPFDHCREHRKSTLSAHAPKTPRPPKLRQCKPSATTTRSTTMDLSPSATKRLMDRSRKRLAALTALCEDVTDMLILKVGCAIQIKPFYSVYRNLNNFI